MGELSLLSSDPCPAAVLRTLRAGWAPGTDRARGSCSSALPPLLQLRPKGLHSFCLRRLEVFAQVCRQYSRLESQRFPFRVSQAAGSWGSFSRHPRRLRRLLLLLCSPEALGVEALLLSAPSPGRGPLTSAPRIAHIHIPGGSIITAQLQARGLVARPAEPLRAEAASRCRSLSFVGQRGCRGLRHPGATP